MGWHVPKKETLDRARADKAAGKSPSTQAGEFVREEMEKFKEGDPDIKSRAQAIAIGLSKARRAGADLPPPEPGEAKEETVRKAERDYEKGQAEGPLAEEEG